MAQTAEFKKCFDELDLLRSTFLETYESSNERLSSGVSEVAQKQLSCLETSNDFFRRFSTDPSLKDHLESDQNVISMPERECVSNLIGATKAALDIHREGALERKCEPVLDKPFFDAQRSSLNKFSYYDLNNHEFNRYFRHTVQHYGTTTENEELGDSTVNTIVSEDVLTSSPI